MSELPTKIGKYKVVAKLGQGGMARVLLCLSAGPGGFNKLLVLKQLREELAAEDEFLTMFLDEARLAARLNHPNVVHTYEVGEAEGAHYIAMDYLEGQPFNRIIHRVKRPNLPVDVYLPVLSETLAGLHYAHELSDFDGSPLHVVHRDVSPHNIFVTYDGEVKLVDFGIAKAAGAATVTREGVFKGKIRYMAPEQANLEALDHRADIYAVGVILWECLTGERINKGADDQFLLLQRRMSGEDPPVLEVNPDANPELAAICDRAMAPDPDARYATALEFQNELEAHMEEAGIRGGKRRLARFVKEHFEDDRRAIAERIEQQVALREEQSSDVPIVDLGSSTPSSDSQTSIPGERQSTAVTAVSGKALDEEPEKKRWPIAAGLAVAAAIAVGGLAATGSDTGGEGATPAPAASAASTARGRVKLVVSASPPEATISVDGAVVAANPFEAEFDEGGRAHRIRVEAEGFETEERMVVFDRDHRLTIDLAPAASPTTEPSKPEPEPEPSKAETEKPEPEPRRPVRPKPRPTEEPASKPSKPAPPSPQPPPPPASRPIDEGNPYK